MDLGALALAIIIQKFSLAVISYLRTCARQFSVRTGESGIGIAEVLIAGAIGTAIIAGLMTAMRATMRTASKADSAMDLVAI